MLRNNPFLRASGTSQPPFPFNDRYIVEDNSQVTLYTDDPRIFPGYPARKLLRNTIRDGLKVSLIASVKNEAENVVKWTDCINKQSRRPDEIVILDGGSTDGTDRLRKWGEPGAYAAKVNPGTRVKYCAWQKHSNSLVGATPSLQLPILAVSRNQTGSKNLSSPFTLSRRRAFLAGFYKCISQSGKVLSGNGTWPGLEQLDPQSFLPSSRSVAFQKEALDEVGGILNG